jgi:hypothetical protein
VVLLQVQGSVANPLQNFSAAEEKNSVPQVISPVEGIWAEEVEIIFFKVRPFLFKIG